MGDVMLFRCGEGGVVSLLFRGEGWIVGEGGREGVMSCCSV